MFDGPTDAQISDMRNRIHPPADRRQAATAGRQTSLDPIDIWHAPLHLGFSLGIFMAVRVLGIR